MSTETVRQPALRATAEGHPPEGLWRNCRTVRGADRAGGVGVRKGREIDYWQTHSLDHRLGLWGGRAWRGGGDVTDAKDDEE